MWWHEGNRTLSLQTIKSYQVHKELCATLIHVLEHNCFDLARSLLKCAKLWEGKVKDKSLCLTYVYGKSWAFVATVNLKEFH